MTSNELMLAIIGGIIGVAASSLQSHLRRKRERERRLREELDRDDAVRRDALND